ncbi:TatD family hydrolase [Segetibacter sp.]|jgi:TatD DNase family protein|uniref:TatD family hydrolase n=1 Tax=Segetibacter sp. TaxID=2231182 RepID=UPI00262A9BC2|nr:TatD family hydrolase [Segetibacter sp.]MCW3081061.1 TatD family deoxyribonuclease [Segetibacter sp.]
MRLIDSHTHLYSKEFENDFHEVLQRARNAGVAKFFLPAIDSGVVEDMLRLEEMYPGECFSMMGIHPCSVKENYQQELEIVEKYLAERTFVAVGEIGLDFYWDTTYKQQQFDAFNKQMEWALQYRSPIVIHTRNAMAETIEAVKPFASKGLTGIFHCFGDNNETAKQIIDLGFLLGIGGVLTYKNANLAEALKDISLHHIVLETDAPYLSPVPYRGKRNESSYLAFIAQKLADIKGVTVEEVAEITSANAEKIFGQ